MIEINGLQNKKIDFLCPHIYLLQYIKKLHVNTEG